jgi:ArsR family transcriptional regulator
VPEPGYAFTALADPTRRAILSLLQERRTSTVGDIAEAFPTMTRAAVSAHLRVLRHAELVQERRRGQFREYSLGPNRADEVVAFLISTYRAGLDHLQGAADERAAETESGRRPED